VTPEEARDNAEKYLQRAAGNAHLLRSGDSRLLMSALLGVGYALLAQADWPGPEPLVVTDSAFEGWQPVLADETEAHSDPDTARTVRLFEAASMSILSDFPGKVDLRFEPRFDDGLGAWVAEWSRSDLTPDEVTTMKMSARARTQVEAVQRLDGLIHARYEAAHKETPDDAA
jgi:hypothetical protein